MYLKHSASYKKCPKTQETFSLTAREEVISCVFINNSGFAQNPGDRPTESLCNLFYRMPLKENTEEEISLVSPGFPSKIQGFYSCKNTSPEVYVLLQEERERGPLLRIQDEFFQAKFLQNTAPATRVLVQHWSIERALARSHSMKIESS